MGSVAQEALNYVRSKQVDVLSEENTRDFPEHAAIILNRGYTREFVFDPDYSIEFNLDNLLDFSFQQFSEECGPESKFMKVKNKKLGQQKISTSLPFHILRGLYEYARNETRGGPDDHDLQNGIALQYLLVASILSLNPLDLPDSLPENSVFYEMTDERIDKLNLIMRLSAEGDKEEALAHFNEFYAESYELNQQLRQAMQKGVALAVNLVAALHGDAADEKEAEEWKDDLGQFQAQAQIDRRPSLHESSPLINRPENSNRSDSCPCVIL